MKFEKKHWFGIGAGLLISLVGGILFFGSNLFYFMLVLGVIVGLMPFIFGLISARGVEKDKERKFLEFVRDLVENVKSGTPVSKGILNLSKRDYGSLSGHVGKLANQISLGIPLTTALENFAADIKSKTISRAVSLISEAERSGGNIGTILESVANSVNQTENLKQERKSSVSNLIVQGYIIFLVFIVIMLVLDIKILPLTEDLADTKDLGLSSGSPGLGSGGSAGGFSTPLFVMILIQSFFAGLVIGKISEGSLKDGIKHSFILVAITLLITTGVKTLFG